MHPTGVLEVHPINASVVDYPHMTADQTGDIGEEHCGRGENGGQRTECSGSISDQQ